MIVPWMRWWSVQRKGYGMAMASHRSRLRLSVRRRTPFANELVARALSRKRRNAPLRLPRFSWTITLERSRLYVRARDGTLKRLQPHLAAFHSAHHPQRMVFRSE